MLTRFDSISRGQTCGCNLELQDDQRGEPIVKHLMWQENVPRRARNIIIVNIHALHNPDEQYRYRKSAILPKPDAANMPLVNQRRPPSSSANALWVSSICALNNVVEVCQPAKAKRLQQRLGLA